MVSAHKRQKIEVEDNGERQIIIQFQDPDGNVSGPELDVSLNTNKEALGEILNKLLEKEDDSTPYSFQIGDDDTCHEISNTLEEAFKKLENFSSESVLTVVYHPLAVFKVRSVTRCTSSMEGHTEAVLCSRFSPNCNQLITGSGDCTLRLWELQTSACEKVLKGHTNWVFTSEWSPCGEYIASGGQDNIIIIWNNKGMKLRTLKGHKNSITNLFWQPLHCCEGEKKPMLASCSKDSSCKLWDIGSGTCVFTLSGHTDAIMQVRWSGENYENGGLIYTGSRDRTIKIWNPKNGAQIKNLKGHAHWINTLSLNTENVLRTGHYDSAYAYLEREELKKNENLDLEFQFNKKHTILERKSLALKRYLKELNQCGGEKLLSCSDDFTLILWDCKEGKQINRMTGHQKVVSSVNFSPDGRYIASGSFDKSIRIWDGRNGKFICTLRGHVQSVFQLQWSQDSRLLLSGSKDSTLKVWDIEKKKLKNDLPGHADEIYTCDWATNGSYACSGGKDRIIKIWRF